MTTATLIHHLPGHDLSLALKGETKTYAAILENGHENHEFRKKGRFLEVSNLIDDEQARPAEEANAFLQLAFPF